MRAYKSVLVIASLVLSTIQAAAYQDSDGTLKNTLHNYSQERTRYVITYKQADDTNKESYWKMQVLESVKGDLESVIETKTFSIDQTAEFMHKAYVRDLKKIGYIDPSEAPIAPGDQADLGVLTGSPTARDGKNPIWKATNQWSWEWEVAYSNWIKTSVDKFFFTRNNIPTDCADVVISLRWIFARMHGLPVANTLTGSGTMVGHMTENARWSNLPTHANWREDQRFMTALTFVREGTYTGSLKGDSYPIQITKEVLIPGAHHLEFHTAGGHAMIISNVEVSRWSAKVEILESTLPVEVRQLRHREYMYGIQPVAGTGFQRILWPVKDGDTWYFNSPDAQPGYSPEQYEPNFMGAQSQFSAAVHSHLRGVKSGEDKFNQKNWEQTLVLLKYKFMERALAVREALITCPTTDCAPGTQAWQDLSTPSRDGKIKDDVMTVLRTIEAQKNNRDAVKSFNMFLADTFDLQVDRLKMTNQQAMINFRDGNFSSDPRTSLQARWGL